MESLGTKDIVTSLISGAALLLTAANFVWARGKLDASQTAAVKQADDLASEAKTIALAVKETADKHNEMIVRLEERIKGGEQRHAELDKRIEQRIDGLEKLFTERMAALEKASNGVADQVKQLVTALTTRKRTTIEE